MENSEMAVAHCVVIRDAILKMVDEDKLDLNPEHYRRARVAARITKALELRIRMGLIDGTSVWMANAIKRRLLDALDGASPNSIAAETLAVSVDIANELVVYVNDPKAKSEDIPF